jgi:TPR repeat protein
MYANGEGVPKDSAEAAKRWRLAADQGLAGAQFNLGWMYQLGYGVPKDSAKAAKWYRKAVKQGHAEAKAKLDLMLA